MRHPWNVIAWWELRRIPYNLALLVAGLTSTFAILLIGSRFANPGEDVFEPLAVLVGAAIWAVAANACYTFGWISELLWAHGDTARTALLRGRVFRIGLIFSIALTLLPAIGVPLLWAIFGFHHGPADGGLTP
jgi:hypothetical protein